MASRASPRAGSQFDIAAGTRRTGIPTPYLGRPTGARCSDTALKNGVVTEGPTVDEDVLTGNRIKPEARKDRLPVDRAVCPVNRVFTR